MAKLKKWPKDETESVSAVSVLKPLRALVGRAYGILKSRPKAELAKHYKGYAQGRSDRATSGGPEWHFSEEGITYHAERGRDVMDIILLQTFLAGVEQGRRIESKESGTIKGMLDRVTDLWKRIEKAKARSKKT